MKAHILVIVLSCGLLLVGCRGTQEAPDPSPVKQPDAVIRDAMLGRWVSNTTPEMAAERVTMTFLDSGEYQFQGPFFFNGKPVTVKVDGKNVAVPLIVSGLWELKGDQLAIHINQTNQPSLTLKSGWAYVVKNVSKERLLLHGQGEGGKLVALFRAP